MRSFSHGPGAPGLILHALTALNRARRGVRTGLTLLGLAVLLLARPAVAGDAPLVFGVFPHLTAREIVETYRPLVDVLEHELQRKIVIHSARSFAIFAERTRRGEYDILLTAPHLAWLARQDAGYRPLLKYTQPVHGLLVVQSGSAFDAPAALRDHTIAIPDTLAVVVLALQAELTAHGLTLPADYRTIDAGTHRNALMQVLNGRADAAMLGLPAYNLLPAELRRQVRVLARTPPLSSLMYLTHARLRDADALHVREALLKFGASPAGQAFLQRGGYVGFTDADGRELRAFRPYALQLQKALQSAR